VSPGQLHGTEQIEGLSARRQRPGGAATAVRFEVQLVVRAIGYQAEPLPELPFDEARCVVPNHAGRIVNAEGDTLAGEYVAGWLKRGPSGVIGTNRGDAVQTIGSLAADLAELPARAVRDPDGIRALLAGRGVRPVDWTAWKRLESHETALGLARRAVAVKVADRMLMLTICHGLTEPA
jgi:ferredoxin--NADP+ reductase